VAVQPKLTTSEQRGDDVNVFAIRHGETAWSLSGKHTGTTDIPLTDNGRRLAERMRHVLARNTFALVLTSPMQRAWETCELAGLGDGALVEPDLVEWNYGDYEGLTPEQIHEIAPSWLIFRDGCPGGETPEEVVTRVDRVLARARAVDGNVALFAHGHILRVLAARWVGLPASAGKHFLLNTGTLSVLAYYHDIPAVNIWNGPFFDNTMGEHNTKGEAANTPACNYTANARSALLCRDAAHTPSASRAGNPAERK
jgi:broad specificity phosphatase PhoE